MKKKSHLALWLVVVLTISLPSIVVYAWSDAGRDEDLALEKDARNYYQAPHELRKMFSREQEVTTKEPSRADLSGVFFLFMGSAEGTYREGSETRRIVTNVRFAWNTGNNTYAIITLPIEKLRIKLVEKPTSATVSFVLNDYRLRDLSTRRINSLADEALPDEMREALKNHASSPEFITSFMDHAVITVQDDEWPTNILLPMNDIPKKPVPRSATKKVGQ